MTHPENTLPVTIAIPTYGREQTLINTIQSLLDLEQPAAEIIIVDQTQSHQQTTDDQLNQWHQQNLIKLIKLSSPSIPHAMNVGLLKAGYPTVLFLDDDIKAHQGLVAVHYLAQQDTDSQIIAGKVIQPWDDKQKLSDDGHQFNSDQETQVNHFMGGNFSINKNQAIESGGFDENFIGVAYRFEKEFADRWLEAGNKILFKPDAVIDHLKETSGGTREYGEHLTTIKPYHAVGAYYYFLVSPKIKNQSQQIRNRLLQSVSTRHHLKRPWYIPVTLIAELRGLFEAKKLARLGPRYISGKSEQNNSSPLRRV